MVATQGVYVRGQCCKAVFLYHKGTKKGVVSFRDAKCAVRLSWVEELGLMHVGVATRVKSFLSKVP